MVFIEFEYRSIQTTSLSNFYEFGDPSRSRVFILSIGTYILDDGIIVAVQAW